MTENRPPFQALREFVTGREKRTSIAPYMDHGYAELAKQLPTDLPDISSLPVGSYERSNRIQTWIEQNDIRKFELACLGMFIADAWEYIKKERGFTKFPSKIDSFKALYAIPRPVKDDESKLDILKRYTLNLARDGIEKWLDNILQHPQEDPRRKVYNWLATIYPILEEGLFDISDPESLRKPEQLVRAGFTTATAAIMNSLFVIPDVYREYQDQHPELIGSQKSLKISIKDLINTLAGGNQGISPALLRALEIKKPRKPYITNDAAELLFSVFNPAYFQIKEKHGNLVLDTRDDMLDKLGDPNNPYRLLRDRQLIKTLVGCPAMYTPAIKELMAWSEKLYTRYGLPQVGEQKKALRGIWPLRRAS